MKVILVKRRPKPAASVPRAGLPGRHKARTEAFGQPLDFTVEPHRATTDVIAGAYPFLAEAGLGSEGVFIGTDTWSQAPFVFDPWVLYQKGIISNPNVAVIGIIGRGKSLLAKTLAARSTVFGRKVYVPLDPNGEWRAVAEAVGGSVIRLGDGNILNPLDEGPRRPGTSNAQHVAEVRERRMDLLEALAAAAAARELEPEEHTALAAALDAVGSRAATPTLGDVVDAIFSPSAPVHGSSTEELARDGRGLGHALARFINGDLAGLFNGPSTVTLDAAAPMVVIDGSGIVGDDLKLALVSACASTWMEAALNDPSAGQRWVIYEEAWRIMMVGSLLGRMNSQFKRARHLGLANMIIFHGLGDLDMVGDAGSAERARALRLIGDCSTKVLYAQEPGDGASEVARRLGLNDAERDQLPGLTIGEALWKVKDRGFLVAHKVTTGELARFGTDKRMGGRSR